MKFTSLEEAVAFEEKWDPRLGGTVTRGHREIAAFAIARILTTGASVDDVLAYFRQCVEQFSGLDVPPPLVTKPS